MWQHYRRTFVGMQIMIVLVSACVYAFFGQDWRMAGTFFLVMQVSAVMGAVWAARLRAVIERRRAALPLEARR